MTIWFTSDQHFWHNNVIEFCDRPFSSLNEMHEELISRYNSKVKSGDSCIFVGDFSFGNSERTKEIIDRLNGYKILVRGNHDGASSANKFDLCVEEMSMNIAGWPVSIKHYPLRWSKDSLWRRLSRKFLKIGNYMPKYIDRYPMDVGQIHIHGHTHSAQGYQDNKIHVGVDAWDFYPVSIGEISKYIQRYKAKEKL